MRFQLLLLTLLSTFRAFACSEAMKPFEAECKAQDRWQKLSAGYSESRANITNVKGYAIPHALGSKNYFESKNDFLTKTQASLSQNKDWQAWLRGKKFFENFNPVFIELNDVLKLHKAMFGFSLESGRLRIGAGETNPVVHYSCNDNSLSQEAFNLLESYDLKSSEGYPLLRLENLVMCEDQKSYAGDLLYYKGASMKTELKSWLADYNDLLNRYTSLNNTSLVSPYAFLADMKRWFLAIHPFSTGNEMIANLLVDYAASKLELPPLMMTYTNAQLLPQEENRERSLKETMENLNFLESCLFDIRMNFIAPQCSNL